MASDEADEGEEETERKSVHELSQRDLEGRFQALMNAANREYLAGGFRIENPLIRGSMRRLCISGQDPHVPRTYLNFDTHAPRIVPKDRPEAENVERYQKLQDMQNWKVACRIERGFSAGWDVSGIRAANAEKRMAITQGPMRFDVVELPAPVKKLERPSSAPGRIRPPGGPVAGGTSGMSRQSQSKPRPGSATSITTFAPSDTSSIYSGSSLSTRSTRPNSASTYAGSASLGTRNMRPKSASTYSGSASLGTRNVRNKRGG
eukprot:gnl/TRDRNA2_/TRDRNA2_125945_c0_seq1.p1 gnl/TRDRNA2_/TRDRNA2_125945_c0~~gnl/TRDRNA2_/TRDRNA2_125945_c0_seq1.p1  ORF type:complete len:262 (+),score=20.37 gnl/TRDRNA2_/TRDRNA2_125945_c0_seq1:136-921(+)